MASSGPNSPSSVVNNASIGTSAWSNPGNATASDNVDATNRPSGFVVVTNYLLATQFGFSIPTDATIDGVLVEVEAARSSAGSFQDSSVRLVVGGTISGNDNSDNQLIGKSDTYYSWGGSTDTWGLSLTPSDVNGSTFGFAWAAEQFDDPDRTLSVDHMRITVYYTVGSTSSIIII